MASSSIPPPFSVPPAITGKYRTKQPTRFTLESQDRQSPAPAVELVQAAIESAERMAPRSSQRGGGRSTNSQCREADLSALLSAVQKNELVLLVVSITNAMQDHVCQVFDQQAPPPAGYPPKSVPNKPDSTRPALVAEGCNIVAEQPQTRTLCISEPDGTQGELKKEALAAFQKWQAAVTNRVSEIVVARDQSTRAPQVQENPSNGRQPGRVPGRAPGRVPDRGFGRSPSIPGRPSGGGGGRGSPSDSRPVAGGVLAQSGASAIPLTQLAAEKRHLLLHAMILLVLSLETYQACSRSFIARMASHFRISPRILAEEESRIAWGLSHAASSVYTEEGLLKRIDEGRRERRGRVTGAGGPPTSSCLAPSLNAAKIGSVVGGSGIGTAAAATVLGAMGTLSDGGLAACMFFGMCGPRGSAAKPLDAFTKDVQDVGLLPLHGMQKLKIREGQMIAPGDRRLRLSIGISGWLLREEDAAGPWRVLGDKSEAYALGWEQDTLVKIGASINTVVSSMAWQNAKRKFVNRNIFSSLKAFQWPHGLLKISKIVDNPWSVGMVRADKVGIALADAIINKVQGERGVSLLGYGLGARVIYTCLMSLSERRVFGQVENVLVMGTPAPSSHCVWTALRSAVSGRVINVFSENDFILGFLHRTSCVQFGVAGLQRIQGVYGIENVDASKPVTNHLRYASLVGRILKDVGWEDLNMEEIKRSEEEQKLTEGEQEPNGKGQTTGAAARQQPAKEGGKKARRKRPEAHF